MTPEEVLLLVEREVQAHLYTNTKNGNRQAMLNIIERVRSKIREQQPGDFAGRGVVGAQTDGHHEP